MSISKPHGSSAVKPGKTLPAGTASQRPPCQFEGCDVPPPWLAEFPFGAPKVHPAGTLLGGGCTHIRQDV